MSNSSTPELARAMDEHVMTAARSAVRQRNSPMIVCTGEVYLVQEAACLRDEIWVWECTYIHQTEECEQTHPLCFLGKS